MRKPYVALAALYGVIGIITFGHSAAGITRWYDRNCATAEIRLQDPNCYGQGLAPAFAAALWPFYWSWEFWK